MSPHDARRLGVHTPIRFDDGELGPDDDAWPGEQIRRLDDDYRSWRGDRYRQLSDEVSGNRHERGQTDPRGDGAPAMRQGRGSAHGR